MVLLPMMDCKEQGAHDLHIVGSTACPTCDLLCNVTNCTKCTKFTATGHCDDCGDFAA